MVSESTILRFRAGLRGEFLQPGDPGYEQARKVYNGMIDRRPRAIVRCADVADVIAAVRFGREHDMLTAIRGGGHNAGGLGVCDDGLVIDLSLMRGIRTNPQAATVRVQGGATGADVDHATHAFGLATPTGTVSTTGVAGLTLGGGIGHLARKYGLTIDNLLEADVVLADGRLVTASEREYPDLFWALRGGGGNFGVVTSFLFRTHPVHTVIAGPSFWPIERSGEVLQWYRDFIRSAPDELNGFFAFLTVPPVPLFPESLHLRTMCAVVWCYCGDPAKAEAVTAPIHATGPEFAHIGPMPFPALQSIFDPLLPPGLQWYWKADFVTEMPDAAIAANVAHGSAIPTQLSTTHIYPIDGAVHRVPSNATAWSFREANWAHVIVGIDPEPANTPRMIDWARAYFEAVHPYSAGGVYPNFIGDEGLDRLQATFRDNWEPLTAIKRVYDPDNFFRVNQNIPPRTASPEAGMPLPGTGDEPRPPITA